MFIRLMFAELLKYKRTVIPLMLIIGGILAAGTAFLQVLTDYPQVTWELLAQSGFFCINILALLLTAVFTGIVFVGEYHEGMFGIIFTYPISRLKLYISKYVVTLLMVISLYIMFFISLMIFGIMGTGGFPESDFLQKLIKLTILASVVNFVLVPLTALISMTVKAIGTYILTGMGYFLVYASFNSSDYSVFIPTCLSNKLTVNYLVSECIKKADYPGIIAVSAIIFISAFTIGAVFYSKCDVYK